MRKGIANVLMGIAENGITRPQMLHAPFMVVWDFTKQCNLRCKHCYAEASPEPAPDELSLKEKLEVLRQLDEAEVAAISFSGGESLINKDFWIVVKNSPIMKKLRDRDNYGCTFCKYRYIRGGCRARAYAYYGDIAAPDPSCSFNEVLWKRILVTAR